MVGIVFKLCPLCEMRYTMILLLIDADLMAYAASRVPKDHDSEGFARTEEQVEANCESWLHGIFYEIETKYGYTPTHFKLFLEGINNFRKVIYPGYKSHRSKRVKPPMLNYAKEYLIHHYNAHVSNGVETDDTIASTWVAITNLNKNNIVIIS